MQTQAPTFVARASRMLLACVGLTAASFAAHAESAPIVQEFTVPLMQKAPTVDGTFSEEEWAGCAGFDGLTQATGSRTGELEQRSGRAFVGATEDAFYMALVTELPDGGAKLFANVTKDIFKVVHDDSFEIWIDTDPASGAGVGFQALFNSLGRGVYAAHPRGGAEAPQDWKGNYEIRNGFTETHWVVEVRVPLKEVTATRKITDGTWGIAVCRNWQQGWSQSSAPGNFRGTNTRFRFSAEPLPVVQVAQAKDPFLRDIATVVTVRNPASTPREVAADVRLRRNTMFDLTKAETLTVPPSGASTLTFTHQEDNSTAFDQIVQATLPSDGTVLYRRETLWGKPGKVKWHTTPVKKDPVEFVFSHYPYRRVLRLEADISGMPKDAKVTDVQVTLTRQWSKEVIKQATLAEFDQAGRARLRWELPELADGIYEVSVQARGQNVPTTPVVESFERRHYAWEGNPMGRSGKVFPPFTPIEIQGNVLRTVLRTHTLDKSGLWSQVQADGKDLLAAPMKLTATVGGKEIPVEATSGRFLSKAANEAVHQSELGAGPLKAKMKTTWDVDGTAKCELTLVSTGGQPLEALRLDIPIKDTEAGLMHAMKDGLRKGPVAMRVPAGDGRVWDASRLIAGELPNGFCSYIFLGGPNRGLSWFADNDKNWSWEHGTPNLEVVREGGQIVLRVHFVNSPVTVATPRTLTFGLLAAPVKPQPTDRRTLFTDRKLALLAVDINWLAGPGICGSVYPVARDPYYWRLLERATVAPIPPDEIKTAFDRSRRYFDPFGEAVVGLWHHSMTNALNGNNVGKNLLLYYNRATTAMDEEFATFKDEWLLEEMTGHPVVPNIGEQKLVPSDSYIDFALYWYAKSFEFVNNQGVYWDNWFIAPSYNTEMTDAYHRENGEIVPAAGIWGLRELCKRTFQMMNELGRPALTFPHMTSTSILPMLSYATMQLDWEWKEGEGDAQGRFTREYLQIASTGRLAGLASLPLWNHGFAQDDILGRRSYTGVQMVHDLMFYDIIGERGGRTDHPNWSINFVQALREHVRKPGLKTWTYWDEVPQPVSSGDPNLPLIVHALPGKEAWVVVCDYSGKETQKATLTIDRKALGFDGDIQVRNVETGEVLPVSDNRVEFPVTRHEVLGFKILPIQPTP